ncbi:nitroreductase family protein, partial [Proteus mirabilis]
MQWLGSENMNFMKTIRERRSIRKFNSIPVDQELVIDLLYAARQLYPSREEVAFRSVYAGTVDAKERLASSMLEPLVKNR